MINGLCAFSDSRSARLFKDSQYIQGTERNDGYRWDVLFATYTAVTSKRL